jgi:hypothetical protein
MHQLESVLFMIAAYGPVVVVSLGLCALLLDRVLARAP